MVKIEFTKAEIEKIHNALRVHLRVTDQNVLNEVTEEIQNTGKIRVFGYGSLIKVPHSKEKMKAYPAMLKGFAARFNCAFNFYGGTKKFPSLMLGLEDDQNGSTPGLVYEKNLEDEVGENSADGIVNYISQFEQRENPEENPIYDFGLVRVQPQNGNKPVLTFTCITKKDGPLFVGNNLALWETAIIIASEFGDERRRTLSGIFVHDSNLQAHHQTIYNYLIEMIDARYKKEFQIEQELLDLVEITNYFRREMPVEYRIFLEQKESRLFDHRNGDLKENLTQVQTALSRNNDNNLAKIFRDEHERSRNLDSRVFNCFNGPTLTTEQFFTLQWQARQKLRQTIGIEPLPSLPYTEESPEITPPLHELS